MRRRFTVASALIATVVGAGSAMGGGAPPTPPATLLARHAPVLILHPAEAFAPVSVEGFLAESDLTARGADGTWAALPGPLPVGGSDLRLDHRACRASNGPAALACYAAAQSRHHAAPTAYGAVFRSPRGVALQYWLFYPYDVWMQDGPKGTVWRAHEGDWEAVTVLLDTREHPTVVGLSAHCGGTRRAWRETGRSDQHPIVHVALGSHANHPDPGTRLQDLACWPEVALPVLEAFGVRPTDVMAAGRRVRPRVVPVQAAFPAWMRFAGRWGEAQYAGFPGVDPLAFGTGPEGPVFHELWRRPFAEPLSWPGG